MKNQSNYSAPALEKGLDIIEYLSTRSEGESLTSIASGIGRSNSEIFRMLTILEVRGFVQRSAQSDGYVLTDKLFHMGLNRPRKQHLMKLAIPAMEAFAKECRQACHLAVRTDNDMVVISRVESPINVGIAVSVGHRLPLAHAPSGRCISAFSRSDEIASIAAEVRKIEGARKAKEFLSALEEIRRVGFSIMKNGFSVGITGVSAPVFDLETKRCVAAITSPILHYVHMANTDLAQIASRLRHYADTVSRQYGNHQTEPKANTDGP